MVSVIIITHMMSKPKSIHIIDVISNDMIQDYTTSCISTARV